MLRMFSLVAVLCASQAAALPRYVGDQAELFAVCSGRMSALLSSQIALRDPEAQKTARALEDFDLLLDAVIDAAKAEGVAPSQPKAWRARGWTEIDYLLNDAQASTDAAEAERAMRSFERHMTHCHEVLLPS